MFIEYDRFQWAKLQMDQLLRLVFVSDIRDFLGKLPRDLKSAYDVIMEQINSQEGRTPEIARRAFLWVMCSRRPLTPGMLADAVRHDPETGAANPIDINISVVLEACRNLVMIDQSGVCRFSHLSVQEYLETCHYHNAQANLEVGSVCLQLLLDPMNWQTIECLTFGLEEKWQDESILRYTVVYWPDHIRLLAEGRIDDRLPSLVENFLGSPNKGGGAYSCWWRAFANYCRNSHYERNRLDSQECSHPAFIVVICGLNRILHGWWTFNLDISSQNDRGQSLLYVAGLNGNLTAAAELLAMGADANSQGGEYGNALQAAALKGSEDVVRLLLDRGADVNAQGGQYGNALQAAALEGNEGVVRLLLDRGADVNAQGVFYGNALQAAASAGNEGVVRLLLDRGADINAQGGRVANALRAAASAGNEDVVRLLLDRGADVNAQGVFYGNALQAAALEGNEGVVRLLLDRGAVLPQ